MVGRRAVEFFRMLDRRIEALALFREHMNQHGHIAVFREF